MNFKKFDPATDCRENLPDLPGNYIVALKPGCWLPACPVPFAMEKYEGLDVVYVGKSKSLRNRDYSSHFNGTAGRSTLRKSLGCFWNYPFVPRDKGNPDSGKVMYSAENEAALSAWMEKNLVLFYCANGNCDVDELSLISRFNPPLNLQGNINPVNSEFRSWLSSRRSTKRI